MRATDVTGGSWQDHRDVNFDRSVCARYHGILAAIQYSFVGFRFPVPVVAFLATPVYEAMEILVKSFVWTTMMDYVAIFTAFCGPSCFSASKKHPAQNLRLE